MAFSALFLVPLPGAMNLLGLPELTIIHNPHAHFGKTMKTNKMEHCAQVEAIVPFLLPVQRFGLHY
jgi:hypothetical protein